MDTECFCLPNRKLRRKILTASGAERELRDIWEELHNVYIIIQVEHTSIYPRLQTVLTPFCYGQVRHKITKYNSSLLDCIAAPIAFPNDGRVAVIPDPDACHCFRVFYNSLFHILFRFAEEDIHSNIFFGDLRKIFNFDMTNVNTGHSGDLLRIRLQCSRNLRGFPFLPHMTPQQLIELEYKVIKAFQIFEDDVESITYQTLDPENLKEQLQPSIYEEGEWCPYPSPNEFDVAANFCKYWPLGRGVGMSSSRQVIFWINQEDHLRVFINFGSGDLRRAYNKLSVVMSKLDEILEFFHDERLGFITVDPERIGTGIRFSCVLRLPQLTRYPRRRERIVHEAGFHERRPQSKSGDLFEYSFQLSLGLSEYESAQHFQAGIQHLLNSEKEVETELLNQAKLNKIDDETKLLETIIEEIQDLSKTMQVSEEEIHEGLLERNLVYRNQRRYN